MKYKYTENVKQFRAKLPWWKWLLGYCPSCGRYFRWPITTQRRFFTQYCDSKCDSKCNYMTSCRECHNDDDDYYTELWREYNAGRL